MYWGVDEFKRFCKQNLEIPTYFTLRLIGTVYEACIKEIDFATEHYVIILQTFAKKDANSCRIQSFIGINT